MKQVLWDRPKAEVFIDLAGRNLTSGSIINISAEEIAKLDKQYIFKFKNDDVVDTYSSYHIDIIEGVLTITIDKQDYENSHYYIKGNTLTYRQGVGYFMDTDKTLTEPNIPADGKATGDKISETASTINSSIATVKGDVEDMIADVYNSTTGTYKAGDFAINNNKLYKAKVDISTPETFNSSKWDEVALGNEVADVKSDLSDSELYGDVYPDVMRNTGSATIVPTYINYACNTTTGQISSANATRVTHESLIYIPDGATFSVANGDSSNYNNATKFCFDKNKNYISADYTASGLAEGTVYVRLQFSRKDNGNISPADVSSVYTISIAKATAEQEISSAVSGIPDIVNDTIFTTGTNKYNPDTKVTGYIKTNLGQIDPNADYFTSDFIDVSDFQYGYAFTPKARKILFYDANKDPITASYYNNETAAGVITLNNSYKYIRLSWYKTSTNVMVADASTLPIYVPFEFIAKNGKNYLNSDTETKVRQMIGGGGSKRIELASYLNGKTVLVFGDSIMHGTGNDDTGIADLLAEKYGMIGADYSVAGATMGVRTDDPDYTADEVHHIAKQVRNAISASVNPDLIILDGGTNDIGESITIGTMSDVYTQPASESYFANGFETVAYLLMSNFVGVPIIYMRAHNMSSRTYQGQIEYGELGIKIAEKWGIHTIDMYKRMNTQLTDYQTAYLDDYTHPNEAGYNKYYIPAIEGFVFSELI